MRAQIDILSSKKRRAYVRDDTRPPTTSALDAEGVTTAASGVPMAAASSGLAAGALAEPLWMRKSHMTTTTQIYRGDSRYGGSGGGGGDVVAPLPVEALAAPRMPLVAEQTESAGAAKVYL